MMPAIFRAVFRRTTAVGCRLRDGFCCCNGAFTVSGIQRGPCEDVAGISSIKRRVANVGECYRADADGATGHGEHDGCGGGRIVANLAFQLLIGIAMTCRRNRDLNRGEEFFRGKCRKICCLIETRGRLFRVRRSDRRQDSLHSGIA
jgi:hypothetical protein